MPARVGERARRRTPDANGAALAAEYGVSEQTVRNAGRELVAAGLLESVRRGGWYVLLGPTNESAPPSG